MKNFFLIIFLIFPLITSAQECVDNPEKKIHCITYKGNTVQANYGDQDLIGSHIDNGGLCTEYRPDGTGQFIYFAHQKMYEPIEFRYGLILNDSTNNIVEGSSTYPATNQNPETTVKYYYIIHSGDEDLSPHLRLMKYTYTTPQNALVGKLKYNRMPNSYNDWESIVSEIFN